MRNASRLCLHLLAQFPKPLEFPQWYECLCYSNGMTQAWWVPGWGVGHPKIKHVIRGFGFWPLPGRGRGGWRLELSNVAHELTDRAWTLNPGHQGSMVLPGRWTYWPAGRGDVAGFHKGCTEALGSVPDLAFCVPFIIKLRVGTVQLFVAHPAGSGTEHTLMWKVRTPRSKLFPSFPQQHRRPTRSWKECLPPEEGGP